MADQKKIEAFERNLFAAMDANELKIREALEDAAEVIMRTDHAVFNDLHTAIDGETATGVHDLILTGVIRSLFDLLIEGYLMHSEAGRKEAAYHEGY